jgi:hypothetical protein
MFLELLFSLSVASSSDWRPRYLSGLSIFTRYEEVVHVDQYTVNYDFSYENNDQLPPSYDKKSINLLIRDSYIYSVDKIRELKIKKEDCKSNLNVHIIHLSEDTINEDSSFDFWRTINGQNISVIHGFYDPTVNVYRNSIIGFVQLPNGSEHVIVHEMAHYWYDRFCVYDKSNIKTEDFAKSVELNYIMNILK